MQVIPFSSDAWSDFTANLNGVAYHFVQHFNERNQTWYFDLSFDSTGVPLVSGVPILLGCDLLAPYALGIGSMYAIDRAASSMLAAVDAGPEDLGVRIQVVFVAPGEVVA
jgi:hypothetical protein